ncbi:uncharacterized protein [Fopius arisanus]|uniref:Uncharacterized protein n=1 Tax=Fopius arisanus TaxID=64838 RepID=A0A9R1SZX4_9HYME|nr:PREDICTED: uncharacterized protein LOC105264775 [Fopius arisanus]
MMTFYDKIHILWSQAFSTFSLHISPANVSKHTVTEWHRKAVDCDSLALSETPTITYNCIKKILNDIFLYERYVNILYLNGMQILYEKIDKLKIKVHQENQKESFKKFYTEDNIDARLARYCPETSSTSSWLKLMPMANNSRNT